MAEIENSYGNVKTSLESSAARKSFSDNSVSRRRGHKYDEARIVRNMSMRRNMSAKFNTFSARVALVFY